MKISRVEEMRELDRKAVEDFAIAEELLMENAGIAACSVIETELGIKGKKFVLICGTGNNGGDGLVIARKIHSMGGSASVYILGKKEKFKGPSKINLEIANRLPVEIKQIDTDSISLLPPRRQDAKLEGVGIKGKVVEGQGAAGSGGEVDEVEGEMARLGGKGEGEVEAIVGAFFGRQR